MNPERYQRIQALLQSALERESEARTSFLDKACAGDESLRQQVESLLVSYKHAESFLESPAAQFGAPLLTDVHAKLAAGDELGPYRILSQIVLHECLFPSSKRFLAAHLFGRNRKPLCILGELCVSVVDLVPKKEFTTEAQSSPRMHREGCA